MEEIKNVNVENTITEVVEEVTDKITFKENIMAYSIAGIFVTGLVTVGYLGYKGTKKLANKIRDKKESKVQSEITVDYVVNENESYDDSEKDPE